MPAETAIPKASQDAIDGEAQGRLCLVGRPCPFEGRQRVVKESSVQVEEKYPELSKLIQTGKERGFIMYEELYENLPEEVTGVAEELDDIYMRLSELDIDIMDAESAEDGEKTPSKGSKADVEDDQDDKKSAAKKNDAKPVATEQLPGPIGQARDVLVVGSLDRCAKVVLIHHRCRHIAQRHQQGIGDLIFLQSTLNGHDVYTIVFD